MVSAPVRDRVDGRGWVRPPVPWAAGRISPSWRRAWICWRHRRRRRSCRPRHRVHPLPMLDSISLNIDIVFPPFIKDSTSKSSSMSSNNSANGSISSSSRTSGSVQSARFGQPGQSLAPSIPSHRHAPIPREALRQCRSSLASNSFALAPWLCRRVIKINRCFGHEKSAAG